MPVECSNADSGVGRDFGKRNTSALPPYRSRCGYEHPFTVGGRIATQLWLSDPSMVARRFGIAFGHRSDDGRC
jgi:hypothetical protein